MRYAAVFVGAGWIWIEICFFKTVIIGACQDYKKLQHNPERVFQIGIDTEPDVLSCNTDDKLRLN